MPGKMKGDKGEVWIFRTQFINAIKEGCPFSRTATPFTKSIMIII
jgi:hypothetical protein